MLVNVFTTRERVAIMKEWLRGLTFRDVKVALIRQFQKRVQLGLLLGCLWINWSEQNCWRRQPFSQAIPITVWKVLCFTWKQRLCYLQVLHKLEDEAYASREAVCFDLFEAANNEELMQNILFSDEGTFHTCGNINKHNCRIWWGDQPNVIYCGVTRSS